MDYTVNLTETATFECVATGIPAPSITWLRNGTELEESNPRFTFNEPSQNPLMSEGELLSVQVTRTLTLEMTEDGDSGSYECSVSNDATPGEDSSSFELVVQSESLIMHRGPPILTHHLHSLNSSTRASCDCE